MSSGCLRRLAIAAQANGLMMQWPAKLLPQQRRTTESRLPVWSDRGARAVSHGGHGGGVNSSICGAGEQESCDEAERLSAFGRRWIKLGCGPSEQALTKLSVAAVSGTPQIVDQPAVDRSP